MPWASGEKSKRAVRGCYGAAGRDRTKKRKCRRMAHKARLFREGKKMQRKTPRRSRRSSRR